MERSVERVGVVGLGTMGSGIVEVFARHGLEVVAVELDDAALERGRSRVEASTARAVDRGRLAEADAAAVHGRITYASGLAALGTVDLVVEAIPERIELKHALFTALDDVVGPECILATNTSSLSVTDIAVGTRHPARVVGMHFFNPATVQRLVEVVRTVVTDPEVVAAVTGLAERLAKTPVVVADRAGFIGNALLLAYLNHAAMLVERGHATREDLDAAMVHGCGYPMGPLALMDLIGLDTCYQILVTMYEQDRDRLHAPAPILRQMVSPGLLGRKSGRGFYSYAAPGSGKVVPDAATPADGPLEGLRAVERVGVLGTGSVAKVLADAVRAAGREVVVVEADGDWGPLAEADLVVEALGAELDATRETFARLDARCRPGAILATTAALPVVELAAATSRPADVIGMHVVGRGVDPRVVEVAHTILTDPAVAATVVALVRDGGLVPVRCPDRAGRVVDALLMPYLNDAVRMLEVHYAEADDIDLAMRNGCGLPTGPLELLDVIGLDVAHGLLEQMHAESREPGHAPSPLLGQLVTAGRLGRRSGRGIREHG